MGKMFFRVGFGTDWRAERKIPFKLAHEFCGYGPTTSRTWRRPLGAAT